VESIQNSPDEQCSGISSPGLAHEYIAVRELAQRPGEWWQDVLGVVGFDRPPPIEARRVPVAASMTPALGGQDGICEVWRMPNGARSGAGDVDGADGAGDADAWEFAVPTPCGLLQYRCAGSLLFGSLLIDERDWSRHDAVGGSGLVRATEAAYAEIFGLLRTSGFPHLVRVWNYLPQINAMAGGEERYRQFNAARKSAFLSAGHATQGSVPAACALGSRDGSPVSIFFLATRQMPLAIENPRQVSAYHYPSQYGAHSPLFARASVLPDTPGTNLFISGTASIVGHETRHRGDAAAQTRESLANIAAVVAEANRVVGAPRYSLQSLSFKVYVRRPMDLAAIQAEIRRALPPDAPIVYLQADVCREDLLVEIEANGAANS
jgi:enamine deaminase RidA (YjgF/YER057c/UK114 family)